MITIIFQIKECKQRLLCYSSKGGWSSQISLFIVINSVFSDDLNVGLKSEVEGEWRLTYQSEKIQPALFEITEICTHRLPNL